jgi:hypothetical protein
MGRWAQAQRRGGGAAAAAAIGPPPAPTLLNEAGRIIQRATGGDDTDGYIAVEQSESGEGGWEEWDIDAWQAVRDWGSFEAMQGYFYRAKEVGNGSSYIGDSDWSAVLDLL